MSAVLEKKEWPVGGQCHPKAHVLARVFVCQRFCDPVLNGAASPPAGMAEAAAKEQEAENQHQANVNAAINAAELIFAGAVVYGTAVSAAQASRPIVIQSPPVQNNYYIQN